MVAERTKATGQKAARAGQEVVEKFATNGADAFTKGYEQYLAASREQVAKLFPSAAKNFDELAEFNKGNFDAFMAAGTAAAKGFEILSQQLVAYNQKAVENGVATAKALLGCKTMQDMVEVHSDLTRKRFDEWLAEGTKLSELTVAVANQAAEPINARVSEAVDRLMKPLAA